MGKAPEKPFSFLYFGDELIKSEDLDPVYCCLARAGLDDDLLKRVLLAYWCYYSVGTALRIAESSSFYEGMWRAHYEKWPHGFERRYFYSDLAYKAIRGLENSGPPESVVDTMTQHDTFQAVHDHVTGFYGFGQWMAWKVADMAERVLRVPVDFSDASLGIYRDPVMGAALLLYGDKHHDLDEEDVAECCEYLNEDFGTHKAPPHYDRWFNIQESETIMCKIKAYHYGQYYLGKDIHEVALSLQKASTIGCDLAQHILQYMPKPYEPSCDPYPYLGEGYHPNVCGLDYL